MKQIIVCMTFICKGLIRILVSFQDEFQLILCNWFWYLLQKEISHYRVQLLLTNSWAWIHQQKIYIWAWQIEFIQLWVWVSMDTPTILGDLLANSMHFCSVFCWLHCENEFLGMFELSIISFKRLEWSCHCDSSGDALKKLEERGVVIRFVIGRRFFHLL